MTVSQAVQYCPNLDLAATWLDRTHSNLQEKTDPKIACSRFFHKICKNLKQTSELNDSIKIKRLKMASITCREQAICRPKTEVIPPHRSVRL